MVKTVAIALATVSALAGMSTAEAATPLVVEVNLSNVELSAGQNYNGSIDLSSYLTGSNGELYRPIEMGGYAYGSSAPVTQQYGGVFSASRSVVDVEKTYDALVAAKKANPNVDLSDVTPYLRYSPVGLSESFSMQIDTQPDFLFMTAGGRTGGSLEFGTSVMVPTNVLFILQASSAANPGVSPKAALTHLNGTAFDVLGGATPSIEIYEPGTSLVVTHPVLPASSIAGLYTSYAGTIISGTFGGAYDQFGGYPGFVSGASGFPTGAFDPTTGLFNYTLTASTNGTVRVDRVGVGFLLEQIGSVAPVPEPASWAMMLVGFGAVGAALRRRRMTVRYA